MSLTAAVKDEVLGLPDAPPSTRLAELTTILRFGGGLHLVGGKLAVEIELDHAGSAQRVRHLTHILLGVPSTATVIPANANRKVETVRVLVTAPIGDLVGVLRGAFLARGIVSDPGRSQIIEIVAPTNEAAMALVGACSRCGISAKTRDIRGGFRVVIRDTEAISAFLNYIGAAKSLDKWSEARATREVRANANRLVNFDDANLRRSAQAAVAACARVERAFEILGTDIPDHLAYAGRLRLDNREASLDELGHHATPIMTKDAVAGRIRRLLAMADKKAADLRIPSTSDGIPDLDD